jgi:hypothetical protein
MVPTEFTGVTRSTSPTARRSAPTTRSERSCPLWITGGFSLPVDKGVDKLLRSPVRFFAALRGRG